MERKRRLVQHGRRGFAGLAMILLAASGCASEPEGRGTEAATDWASLVEAERAFAQAAAAQGVRSAFLAYLADASILFRPTPVDGRAWFAERPETPGLLAWQPAFAEVSGAGDLGYTTGSWTFHDTTGSRLATGHYVTAWGRQADGTWRALIDAGISHPPADGPAPDTVMAPAAPAEALPGTEDREAARQEMLQADEQLAAAVRRDGVPAFEAVADADVRLYRDGAAPHVGKAAARAALAEEEGAWTWELSGGAVAQSGDLGYTYGISTRTTDGTAATSSYLRLWRRGAANGWQVVLDLASPIPPSE